MSDPIIARFPDGEPAPLKCDYCFAITLGVTPHGVGNPCPMKADVDKAYIEKLDAERMYFIRSGGGTGRIADAFEKFTGVGEEDQS